MAEARTMLRTGIGLRAPHMAEVMATHPPVPWFEVHAENYFGGGAPLRALEKVRCDHPIAVHAVGLSLGSADGPDEHYLRRLAALEERIDPLFVSEHLSWSVAGGAYLNHLLPLPYTVETLDLLCRHLDRVQERLQRRILIENPSAYLRFRSSRIPEAVVLAELARRTGCGLLCDVNNIYVSARNLGTDPVAYLDDLPADAIEEIHLAGHTANEADGLVVLIDDHGSRVAEPVWDLYALAVSRFGPVPTLVEWDTDLPSLDVLLEEARRADARVSSAQPVSGNAGAA